MLEMTVLIPFLVEIPGAWELGFIRLVPVDQNITTAELDPFSLQGQPGEGLQL